MSKRIQQYLQELPNQIKFLPVKSFQLLMIINYIVKYKVTRYSQQNRHQQIQQFLNLKVVQKQWLIIFIILTFNFKNTNQKVISHRRRSIVAKLGIIFQLYFNDTPIVKLQALSITQLEGNQNDERSLRVLSHISQKKKQLFNINVYYLLLLLTLFLISVCGRVKFSLKIQLTSLIFIQLLKKIANFMLFSKQFCSLQKKRKSLFTNKNYKRTLK
ncbi:transmembrane protein, putative (macronuclear) [Tetrahymena thermophila SB210]|uniref:Transmembrane protein, putative n=1 Tax=Tetrahymena thermophila (strain SB210) TaxID=312017 RepID=W7XDY2_TETTS|nr:transmembrane protein, putative [Tetrahymena thermophila SB210]EWS71054.1 transmembrane protein, putative [Tetrahymena thermophila SB210]|eukprot:XP_012656420.1 transmembrane protein, putative [Tetrahymena thermophila SB210]